MNEWIGNSSYTIPLHLWADVNCKKIDFFRQKDWWFKKKIRKKATAKALKMESTTSGEGGSSFHLASATYATSSIDSNKCDWIERETKNNSKKDEFGRWLFKFSWGFPAKLILVVNLIRSTLWPLRFISKMLIWFYLFGKVRFGLIWFRLIWFSTVWLSRIELFAKQPKKRTIQMYEWRQSFITFESTLFIEVMTISQFPQFHFWIYFFDISTHQTWINLHIFFCWSWFMIFQECDFCSSIYLYRNRYSAEKTHKKTPTRTTDGRKNDAH